MQRNEGKQLSSRLIYLTIFPGFLGERQFGARGLGRVVDMFNVYIFLN